MYTLPKWARHLGGGRLNNLVEEIELADKVGLDVYGVGEHHRPDYAASAPVIVLAAAAARTKNIRLTSAVTVLSSDDPVRVYQNFATLDLLSHGRAEIMVGRGSFIESYPLFGYDLNDYDVLFSEKLDLLLKLRAQEHVTWSGTIRAPLSNAGIYPARSRIRCRCGWGWRHAAIGGAGGNAGPAHGSGDHWRGAGALQAPCGFVPRVSPTRRAQ